MNNLDHHIPENLYIPDGLIDELLAEFTYLDTEEKHLREEAEQQQLQTYLKPQVKRDIFDIFVKILLFIFLVLFKPLTDALVSSYLTEIRQEPRVILRDDFYNRVAAQTRQGVIKAIGEPDKVDDSLTLNYGINLWYYNSIKDSVSDQMGFATVLFKKGVVDKVKFNSYSLPYMMLYL